MPNHTHCDFCFIYKTPTIKMEENCAKVTQTNPRSSQYRQHPTAAIVPSSSNTIKHEALTACIFVLRLLLIFVWRAIFDFMAPCTLTLRNDTRSNEGTLQVEKKKKKQRKT